MSLREDLKVFRQPGFYVSAAIVVLLIGGILLLGGLTLNQTHL